MSYYIYLINNPDNLISKNSVNDNLVNGGSGNGGSGNDNSIDGCRSGQAVIYNKISSFSGKSIYPDIVFFHPYKEASLTDDKIYEEVEELMKEYGSSRIVVASAFSDNDIRFIENVMQKLFPDIENGGEKNGCIIRNSEYAHSVNDMCDKLMLSHAMRLEFEKMIAYYIETGGNPEDLFMPFKTEYPLPVSCKKEGKKIYELIRNKILG